MAGQVPYHEQIKSRYAPAVAVVADTDVQAACRVNGLSLVDILRACSVNATVGPSGFPFRVETGTVRVEGPFKLRFFEADTLHATPNAATIMHLHNTWLPRVEWMHSGLIQQLSSESILLTAVGCDDARSVAPWFADYANELVRLGMFQNYEMLDHPLAAVYAVDAHANTPATAAMELLQPHLRHSDDDGSISQAMASRTVVPFWHRDFPRHFLVVIDAQKPPLAAEELKERVEALSRSAALAVGNSVVIKVSTVTINSGAGSSGDAGARIQWQRHRHSNLSCPGRHRAVPCAGEPFAHVQAEQGTAGAQGGWLSQQNLDDMAAAVNAIVRETLCQHMERRMNTLRSAVSARRGNFLRSLGRVIGFPARSGGPHSQNGRTHGPDDGLYSFESDESRLRQLADMYFQIGQYRDAEGCYADVAEEFGQRRSTTHQAAALEALALSRYMQMATQGAPSLEVCAPFESAFKAFSRTVSIGLNSTSAQQQGSTLPAVRCGLVFAATMVALGNFQDAAVCCAHTANFCDAKLGAMLLEQVAVCHACMQPPQMRCALRYAMLAGQRYKSWQLPAFAAVCFKAVAQHCGPGWPAVTRALAEHGTAACQATARWLDAALYLRAALGEVDAAALDSDSDAAGSVHAPMLRQLWAMMTRAKEVGQDVSMDQALLSLELPHVDTHTYCVALNGLQVLMHTAAADAGAAQRDRRHFRAIEQHLLGQASRHAALASARRRQRPYTAAFCEEAIQVHTRLHNPLDTPLELADVRLACTYKPRDDTNGTATDTPPFEEGVAQGLPALCERAEAGATAAGVRPIHVGIPAGQSVDVTLEFVPQKQGWLRAEGLRWDIVVPAQPPPTADSSDVGASTPLADRRDSQTGEQGRIAAACFWQPRQHRKRYNSEAHSRVAGECMRGMSIVRAMQAADVAQAPALMFAQRSCLTFAVQPPAPLLYLRPAAPSAALAVDCVDSALAALLFPEWDAAGVALDVPQVLLAGQLAPLALVVSKLQGKGVSGITLATSSPDVAMLPNARVGDLQGASGHELVSLCDHFPPPTRGSTGAHDAAATVTSFALDASPARWTPGDDGFEHMPVTAWLHPRSAGTHRLRLLIAYEAPGGALRTTRLALDLHVVAALSAGAPMLAPSNTGLAAWWLSVPLRQHREVQAHGTLSGGCFECDVVAVRCQYWQLAGQGDAEEAERGHSAEVSTLPEPVSIEASDAGTVRLELKPRAQQSKGLVEAEEALQQRMNGCTLLVPWRHKSGGSLGKRWACGMFVLPALQLAALIQGSALRLGAQLLGTAPGPRHAHTVHADGGETFVDVRMRLRNCGTQPMSLCLECGHFSETAGAPDRLFNDAAGESRASEDLYADQQYVVTTGVRHMWLGGVRQHMRCLAAQAEQELHVQLSLAGSGAFAVSDYVCIWNAPECGILGRVLQGERLEAFVASDASAG